MRKFIKNYNEWFSIPIAIIIFAFSPKLLRLFDPTAAAYDAGILHGIALSAIVLLCASGIAWFLFKLNFPTLYTYWDDEAELDSINKPNRRVGILLSFGIYFGYILIFSITFWAQL